MTTRPKGISEDGQPSTYSPTWLEGACLILLVRAGADTARMEPNGPSLATLRALPDIYAWMLTKAHEHYPADWTPPPDDDEVLATDRLRDAMIQALDAVGRWRRARRTSPIGEGFN